MVHFEAGASITKVLFASDFSAIHISGLPRDSKSETILALLRSHGLDTSNVSNVRVNRGAGISSARVQAEDPGFAKAAGIKLGPQNASSRAAPGIQAVPAPVGISTASDSSALRVDCKKVHCSWHKASKTVWLNFGNGDIADRVAKKFKDGKYKILDQIVHPNDPTRGGGGRHNPKAWTVCLTEVPAAATRADVVNSIRLPSDKPRDVHLGEPTYKADADTCSAVVQSLFTAVGPLEWWELTPDTTGKRMKASARFLNEEDAKEAAKTLNNSALPFHKTAKLTVQIVHSAKFKVSSVIFETVQSQIKANIQDWKQLHLHYIAYPEPDPPKWYRVLKIEGESPSGVAAAKDTIANILAGVVARDGTGVLWHPSLRGNGAILEKLKELQKKTGILIVRNKAKSQLRLYGPQKRCEEVPALIAGILGAAGSEEFVIELSTQQFHWACQGGFKKIISELGPNNVSFDVISTPKRITITGTEVEHDVALYREWQGSTVTKSKGRNERTGLLCMLDRSREPSPDSVQPRLLSRLLREPLPIRFDSGCICADSMCRRLQQLRQNAWPSRVAGAPLIERLRGAARAILRILRAPAPEPPKALPLARMRVRLSHRRSGQDAHLS